MRSRPHAAGCMPAAPSSHSSAELKPGQAGVTAPWLPGLVIHRCEFERNSHFHKALSLVSPASFTALIKPEKMMCPENPPCPRQLRVLTLLWFTHYSRGTPETLARGICVPTRTELTDKQPPCLEMTGSPPHAQSPQASTPCCRVRVENVWSVCGKVNA